MGDMKKLALILTILTSTLIPLAVSNALIFDKNTYIENAKKAGTFDEQSEKVNVVEKLIAFFKFQQDAPNEFNGREKNHLYDVRQLISAIAIAAQILAIPSITILAYFAFKGKSQDALHAIQIGAAFSAALTTALCIAIAIWFDKLFYLFHVTLFQDGSFEFPASDLLIQMFGNSFFYNFGLQTLAYSIFAGISIAIGIQLIKGRYAPIVKKSKK